METDHPIPSNNPSARISTTPEDPALPAAGAKPSGSSSGSGRLGSRPTNDTDDGGDGTPPPPDGRDIGLKQKSIRNVWRDGPGTGLNDEQVCGVVCVFWEWKYALESS